MRCAGKNREEETVISRIRFGHTGLNSTLFVMGKHNTGRCEYCGQEETIEHVIVHCERYEEERGRMSEQFRKERVQFDLVDILQGSSNKCYQILMLFLRVTNLFGRI